VAKKKKKKKLQKTSLTKKILVGLGIPALFIPGLILASLLGWDWKKGLAELKAKGGYYQYEELFPKQALVAKVRDGDTIELENGRVVRLLGIDTPERGQPYYLESVSFSRERVENKIIDLEYGKYQDDKYGRILAYVWIDEGDKKIMLNLELVKEGWATVVVYKDRAKLKYEDELLELEEKAKKERKGIWEENF